jgi:hypothetical protein
MQTLRQPFLSQNQEEMQQVRLSGLKAKEVQVAVEAPADKEEKEMILEKVI